MCLAMYFGEEMIRMETERYGNRVVDFDLGLKLSKIV